MGLIIYWGKKNCEPSFDDSQFSISEHRCLDYQAMTIFAKTNFNDAIRLFRIDDDLHNAFDVSM